MEIDPEILICPLCSNTATKQTDSLICQTQDCLYLTFTTTHLEPAGAKRLLTDIRGLVTATQGDECAHSYDIGVSEIEDEECVAITCANCNLFEFETINN
jgi:hypothetical protein